MKETKPAITLTPEQTIEKLLDNFDFEKVQQVMLALNWKYYDSKEVPSLDRIKTSARFALMQAWHYLLDNNKKKASSGAGGFNATVRKYKDGEILFKLDLVVTGFNWSNRDTCY